MADYFTQEHFELLQRWGGQKRDNSIPEQNQAYDELKRAYNLTEVWAKGLKDVLFPDGSVKIRKRPTSQGNQFTPYNWAKIYPTQSANKKLSYTVGLNADNYFIVKIDTVACSDDSPERQAYEALRVSKTRSPIVRRLPADQGLQLDMAALIEWSRKSISEFEYSYDEVLEQIGLSKSGETSDHQSFIHFSNGQHGVSLDNPPPSSIGHCMDVWVVSEKLRQELGRMPEKDELEKDARLADSNKGNVRQEFYRWRRWRNDDNVSTASTVQAQTGSYAKDRTQPVNRIYYGPPGTGKTYALSQLLRAHYEQATSTIAPNEWRQQFLIERFADLTWWEGIAAALYELGGKAKVPELSDHPIIQSIIQSKGRTKNVSQTLWGTLQNHAIEESVTVGRKQRHSPAVFDKSSDSVWQLAGDWKEACADIITAIDQYQAGPKETGLVKRYSFVTFHQSYGYEEFVEGLRPVLSDDTESSDIRYEIKSGIFMDLCQRARQSPEKHFAMVIDEINRGNISKIFGELITLIESDKREGAANALSVTLPYSGKRFSVPANVDIIGTMNTADRSLALLDTALRRRFDFVSIMPDASDKQGAPLFNLRVNYGDAKINIPLLLEAVNLRIEALYDRDHCIGHAYFTTLQAVADGELRFVALQQIFRNRLLPLLEEYFFEDWQKIALVLGDNQKPQNLRFIMEVQEQEEDLARLFGNDHGLDAYSARHRFTLQESAFTEPLAYTNIYENPTG